MFFTREMTVTDYMIEAKLLAKMRKLFASGMKVSQSSLQHIGVIKMDDKTESKTNKKDIDGSHSECNDININLIMNIKISIILKKSKMIS